MTTKRPPAPPPRLPGFTFVEVLGSGGFADVYLYEQQLPRRRVAVKVMLPDRMVGGAAEQFAAEANVMALLSTHPAIVTIHQAGVSDDGRPYLVMEYCPRPNLQVRYRAGAFSVAEALRVGVQVAAAVETAHRAGILHRDIKPANILVTEYNRPALTDFGIATTLEGTDESQGMSIPWSPPESFDDAPASGVRSDVYALGATVYTLLAGRSPFEQPGGRNGGAELIQRIERDALPPLGRADAPDSLHHALERAMSKRPVDRYDSAVAFARALQRVQIELAHSVTPIDILDDAPPGDDADDEQDAELTRVRGIASIEPQTAPAAGRTHERRPGPADHVDDPAASAPDDTVRRSSGARAVAPAASAPVAGDVSPTVLRPRTVSPDRVASDAPDAAPAPAAARAPRSRRAAWIAGAVGVAVVVVAGIVLASVLMPQAEPEPVTTGAPQDPRDGVVPAPAEVAGTVTDAGASFTWQNPDPLEGDVFLWYPVTLDGNGEAERTDATAVTIPPAAGGRTCIEVVLVRADGAASNPKRGCTP